MERIRPADALSRASEGFSVEMFRGKRLPERIGSALDATGKWQQRDRLLSAPVMVWLVLMMSLHWAATITLVHDDNYTCAS